MWQMIVGGVQRLLGTANETIKIFKPSAEASAGREHTEQMLRGTQDSAIIAQYAAEFRQLEGRTWWDSLIDGLNRLPRPTIALAVLWFFALPAYDPERFVLIAQGYQLVPDGLWALLSIVVGFYFAGRMTTKGRDFTLKAGALDQARHLVEQRKGFRELAQEDEPPAEDLVRRAGTEPAAEENRVAAEWRRRQAGGLLDETP